MNLPKIWHNSGFPGGPGDKEPAGDKETEYKGLIAGLGRSPEGNDNAL